MAWNEVLQKSEETNAQNQTLLHNNSSSSLSASKKFSYSHHANDTDGQNKAITAYLPGTSPFFSPSKKTRVIHTTRQQNLMDYPNWSDSLNTLFPKVSRTG